MTHLKSVINDYLEGSADQVPQLRHLQGHLLAGFANFAEDSLHVGPHFCKLNLDLTNWIGNFVLQLQLGFLQCLYDELVRSPFDCSLDIPELFLQLLWRRFRVEESRPKGESSSKNLGSRDETVDSSNDLSAHLEWMIVSASLFLQ